MDRRTATGNDKIQFSLSALTLERRLKKKAEEERRRVEEVWAKAAKVEAEREALKKAEEERRRVEAEARIHVMARFVWLGRLSADAK
jgi:hypothetical protein